MANPYFDPVHVSDYDVKNIINSLEKIRKEFSPTKTKQVARQAAQPLKKDMKAKAPKYPNSKKPKKKWYYYRAKGETKKNAIKYSAGGIKRSVGIFNGKRGIFVAPRIGKLNSQVLGNPRLDGWYAHFIIGGTKNIKQKKPFVEQARLAQRSVVHKNIIKVSEKMIEKKWK
jgi:HK97 gp10 family phage protein